MNGIAEPVMAIDPLAAGWQPGCSNKVLFLDRDGVINVDHGYVHTPEKTDFVPGIFALGRAAREAGYVLIVVTNQAGIARGYYTVEQFVEYTQWLHAKFEREGAPLLATYYCPHHPVHGVGALKRNCECRKPRPGMLLRAARDWNVDLARSALVGDKESDIVAAQSAGLTNAFLVDEGSFHVSDISL